jgi:glucan biosynthesis protein C
MPNVSTVTTSSSVDSRPQRDQWPSMSMTVEDRSRHFGLDWLRIGGFAILILYHIGLYFGPWGWHVRSLYTQAWLAFPLLASAPWRMSLLFVVSGYACAIMLARVSPVPFLKERSWRLLMPLGFAMLIINPPQGWVEAQVAGDTVTYYHWWLVDELHLAPGGTDAPTLSHMWFIAYSWLYAVVFAGWRSTPQRFCNAIRAAAVRVLNRKGMIILPLAWLLLAEVILWPGRLPRNAPANDPLGHAIYFSAFTFGALLAGAPSLWEPIRRSRWLGVAAALAGYAAILWGDEFGAATVIGIRGATLLTDTGYALMIWGAVIGLLAFADLWLNRDHRWRAPLTEAVFPFYIVHQTIIVLTGYWLRPLDLPAPMAFVILLASTAAGCLVFLRVGRMISPLRPLMGLPQQQAEQTHGSHTLTSRTA